MTKKMKLDKTAYKWGIVAIGIVFIIVGSYSFNSVLREFRVDCEFCITQECMDNDILCGDFGIYWIKNAILVSIIVGGCSLICLAYQMKNEK